jgi:putative ABC transport system substrate-binding protein
MKLKRILAIFMSTLLMAGLLTACGSDTAEEDKDADVFKIGVIQLVEHEALDAAYEGFIQGLKDAGLVEGKDYTIDYEVAQGDKSSCQTIAEKLVSDKCDLILAIATNAAQSVANATDTIPILVTAVTDPADAGLVDSNEKPGTNVSGTSDLTPVEEQIDLLSQLVPDCKKVALLYNSGESNSVFQIGLAKEKLDELGISYQDATVSQSSEIQQVVESLAGKVDAIYTPTDNLIASGIATVAMVANQAKIPVIPGEEGMVKKGGLATYGINYFDLGKLTATQAVDIIKNGANPADMPIQYLTDFNLTINEDEVSALGVTVPSDLLEKATMVKTDTE